ncbi:hypothetical protein [uncultured Roseobacter sp.]|uniref:hypothetical protein n=1 Tax=uncultured Roseobacter sp. TaxID=114847 RepID=UPI002632A3C6|nr:hypothetical protein [uncultured Roseobacter sp.]
MEHERPEDFFEAMAEAYCARDFKALTRFYDCPGAAYLEDDIVVWSNADSLEETLRQHCMANYALGTRSVAARVVAQSLHGRQHFSVWVNWSHKDFHGIVLFETCLRYFFRRTSTGGLVIQLVEMPDRPLVYENENIRPPFRRTRARTGKVRVV